MDNTEKIYRVPLQKKLTRDPHAMSVDQGLTTSPNRFPDL